MKLVIKKSNKPEKRLMAIFSEQGKKDVITHFGLKNPKRGTFIDTGDKKARAAYRARHKKDLDTKDFKRAGYLSYFILWGETDSLKKNIELYKKKFNLD
tara:strand:+ start:931 stop:1227 length:297 start_codon:yes stop_codon:yes gene_type:complete